MDENNSYYRMKIHHCKANNAEYDAVVKQAAGVSAAHPT